MSIFISFVIIGSLVLQSAIEISGGSTDLKMLLANLAMTLAAIIVYGNTRALKVLDELGREYPFGETHDSATRGLIVSHILQTCVVFGAIIVRIVGTGVHQMGQVAAIFWGGCVLFSIVSLGSYHAYVLARLTEKAKKS